MQKVFAHQVAHDPNSAGFYKFNSLFAAISDRKISLWEELSIRFKEIVVVSFIFCRSHDGWHTRKA
jgi:hypothetical protein